jgi:hypothetical protein
VVTNEGSCSGDEPDESSMSRWPLMVALAAVRVVPVPKRRRSGGRLCSFSRQAFEPRAEDRARLRPEKLPTILQAFTRPV